MCLDRTARFKPTKEGIGYKIVRRNDDSEGYVTIGELYPLESKKWNTAERTARNDRDNGFHIFDRKSEALKSNWMDSLRKPILVKVQYGKKYHVGYGDGVQGLNFRTIVAQKMKILEEVKI